MPWPADCGPSVVYFSHFRHFRNCTSDLAETWWEALGLHGDSELLKSLCSVTKMAATVAS